MKELRNGWPSMVPRTLTRPRVPKKAAERQFLDDLWSSSLDVARRLVEAERGISAGDDAAAAG
jgi:hypothetical protein